MPTAARSFSSAARIAALIAALVAALPAQARNVSGGPLRPDQACYDVRHYRLALSVDPAAKAIAGTLAMRATWVAASPVFALDLDAALEVAGVRLDGAPALHRREAGRIVIEPAVALAVGAAFTVEVTYRGTPREAKRPPWDGGFTWARTEDGQPWIATSCQGEGADLWWPCKDHPSDEADGFELVCTVPDGLVVAGNGVRQGEPERADGATTYRWRTTSPINNYGVALAIAPYVELTDTYTCVDGTKLPIQFFVLPASEKRARACMPQFLDHLRAFEELLGPYPFRSEKYGIAETPFLGMEHQTIVAYGNGFADPEWDWLHHHELAHEWWGNLVTCRDWKDMWLHEGFGTYMQPLYRERRFGRAAYDADVRGYVTMNRTPLAPRESRTSAEIYFAASGNDVYYKGALVLHTLRWQLGDEAFFTLLRRFCYPTAAAAKTTDGSQCRFVDTDELVALASEIAGEDLAWFFEVYVRTPGLPRLEHELDGGVLKLRWHTARDLPFALPAPIEIGGELRAVPMPGGIGSVEVGDAEYRVDPGHRVLMQRQRR